MNKKTKCLILVLFAVLYGIRAQESSVPEKQKKTPGEVLVKEFTACLPKGSPSIPEPVERFTIYLQENLKYTFRVNNYSENESRAIIQLYYRNKLIKSNFDEITAAVSDSFIFDCTVTGNYKLYSTFYKSSGGKVRIVVSTAANTDTNDMIKNENSYGILYAGVDNELSVYTDIPENSTLDFDISEGKLYAKDLKYYANIADTGIITIKTIVKDTNGEVIEEVSSKYRVIELSTPDIMFHNRSGGIIKKSEIQAGDLINISSHNDLFDNDAIESFKISDNLNNSDYLETTGNLLSVRQYRFLQDMTDGSVFYIYDIKIKMPDNKTEYASPLEFVIYE